MSKNPMMSVRSCSEVDALSLAYYLFQLHDDKDFDCELENFDESQFLYNTLVEKLGLKAHSDRVIKALLKKQVEKGVLTPIENKNEPRRHPFRYKGKLSENYKEDEMIYDNSGNWLSNTPHNINMIRLCFSARENLFARLISLTFFAEPEDFQAGKYKLTGNIPVSKKVKDAVNNLDSVRFASETLKLTSDESRFLQLVFRLQGIREMYQVCNVFYRQYEMSRITIYSICSSFLQKDIRRLMKKDCKLTSFGLINDDGEVTQNAIDAFNEKDMRMYFTDIIKAGKTGKAYELDTFSVNENQTKLAVQLLKGSSACNILLYGEPGSGKTEYAKSLAKAAGLNVFSFKNEIEVSENDDETGVRRLNCYLSLKKSDSLLIVDEAESVLKTTGSFFGMKFSLPQKGTVNNMLENSENKVIWILNYTSELDESTLRRFTYSIQFHEMPKETLRSITDSKISKVKMSKNLKNEILDICGEYRVTGASVENILKTVKSLDYIKTDEKQVIKDVRNVLESNSSLIYGKKKIRDKVKSTYSLDVLNTSIPAPSLVEMIENAVEYNKENQDCQEGIRMLFYGLSGTGKTELARYISKTLGKKLLLKRASDILNKYVGEAEKNIREAFEEAEATDSILLFDEADSFFADRNNANQSWERTMVNEFLTQMEEFSGILICTTNLRKIMDPAMNRRFHQLVEFKPLNEQGVKTLLNSYFGNIAFEEEQITSLLKSDTITPSDFGTLKSKMRFVSKNLINSQYIIQELKNAQSEKRMSGSSHIGFVS